MKSCPLRKFLLPLLTAAGLLASLPAAADLVVVVNPKSGVERLSRDEVINIFLGRYRQLPSGISAQPVDMPASQPEKSLMYRLLVGKDLDQIASYWSRLVFSGRTSPPVQATSTEELIRFVAANRGAVGYLDRSRVDSRLRIVLELQ